MRPKGSVQELETRRRKALKLLEEHLSLNEVARRVGCHPSSVMRWRDRIREFGEPGFSAQSPPGRPSRLSEKQKHQLTEYLLAGPEVFVYHNQVWTTQRIADLIEKRFGVSYHRDHVGKLMHSLGWSHQKNEHRAVVENEMGVKSVGKERVAERKRKLSGWVPI